MEIDNIHSWDLNYSEAKNLQKELRVFLKSNFPKKEIRLVAGCDVSYVASSNVFTSAVVIMTYPDCNVLETATASVEVNFPYIPGLLSFREMPSLLESWRKVENVPDMVYCDGSGLIHPRKFGIACHLGLWINLPTIGCAKNLLCGETIMPDDEKASMQNVTLDGEIIGKSLRTRSGAKPMYISPGNFIDVEQSASLVLKACPRYRIPEPIRAAHKVANAARIKVSC